jgi:hypothetical protein|tara:strand:- start:425 stop:709 length:285 start_codon:yes stop_codon:yes gene_type:complete
MIIEIIGGYSMEDAKEQGITVRVIYDINYETDWSFSLEGDEALTFRCEWKAWQILNRSRQNDQSNHSLEEFLYAHDYNYLLAPAPKSRYWYRRD